MSNFARCVIVTVVMTPRDCDTLVAAIQATCDVDEPRAACAMKARPAAEQLTPLLPWMHRTGGRGTPSWRAIFSEQRLAPSDVKVHERADGRERCVYFYVGACALPKGGIVFFVHPDLDPLLGRATFAPFDTGSLCTGYAAPDPSHAAYTAYTPWDTVQQCRYLQDHSGSGDVLASFLPPYLAAHFNKPLDYTTRLQNSSPDFPAYHGLRSPTEDRRSWTVEVQVHGDAGVAIDAEHLQELVVLGKNRFDELPPSYKAFAVLVSDDEDLDDPRDLIAEACARRIHQRFEEASR